MRPFLGSLTYKQDIVGIVNAAINVKTYGAKGDGTDDSSAVLDAMTYAQTIGAPLFFPSGAYNLANWNYQTMSGNIRIIGEDKTTTLITGPINQTFVQFESGSSLTVDGISFANWNVSFRWLPFVPYDFIDFNDCNFDNHGRGGLAAGDGVNVLSLNSLSITKCGFSDIGGTAYIDSNTGAIGGVHIVCDKLLRTYVVNNTIKNVGSSTGVRTTLGISILTARSDTINPPDDTEISVLVKDNYINGVYNNSDLNCGGIHVLGGKAKIVDNHIENVRASFATNVDSEAIYIKARQTVITGNTCINAGGNEAVIKAKGATRDGISQGPSNYSYDNIIAHNHILQDDAHARYATGIAVSGGLSGYQIATNNIEGMQVGIGIESYETIIENNKITRLTALDPSIERTYGIGLAAAANAIVRRNYVYDVQHPTGAAYGLAITNISSTAQGFVIVENNTFEKCISGGGTDKSRGINMILSAGVPSFDLLKISENVIKDTGWGIRLGDAELVVSKLVGGNNTIIDAAQQDKLQTDGMVWDYYLEHGLVATVANLGSAVSEVNKFGKYPGKPVMSDDGTMVFAAGAAITDVWKDGAGITKYTP